MRLPDVVRVLGRDVPLIHVGEDMLPKAVGEYDYEHQIVRLRDGQQPVFEADTVLHELIHAIDDAMQLGMKERQVHCTAVGLIALLRDNPDFLEYLYDALRGHHN